MVLYAGIHIVFRRYPMHKILFFISCLFFNNLTYCPHVIGDYIIMDDVHENERDRITARVNREKRDFEASFKEFVRNYAQQNADEQDKNELNEKLCEVAGDAHVEPELQNSMIKTLLELGASARYVSKAKSIEDIKTPLRKAVAKHCDFSADCINSVRTLIAAGAPVFPEALHKAVMCQFVPLQKRLAIVKTLVSAKANVNAEYSHWGSALYCLARFHMKEEDACEVFKIFKDAEPKPDFDRRYGEFTSLENALSRGRFKVGAVFVEAGACYDGIEKSKRAQLVQRGVTILLSVPFRMNLLPDKKKMKTGRARLF